MEVLQNLTQARASADDERIVNVPFPEPAPCQYCRRPVAAGPRCPLHLRRRSAPVGCQQTCYDVLGCTLAALGPGVACGPPTEPCERQIIVLIGRFQVAR